MEGVFDFITGGLGQFLPDIYRFLAVCFEASLADHHQKYNIEFGQKVKEKEGERLPLNLERRIFTWAVGDSFLDPASTVIHF